MKTYNKLFSILRPAAFALLAAGLASCEADPVELEGGNLPSDRPGTPVGALYSTRSSALETDINIFAEGDVTEKLVYRLTAPVDHDVTVTLEALDWDLETCQEWNVANGYDKYWTNGIDGPISLREDNTFPIRSENYYCPYPVAALDLPNDGTITVPAGKTEVEIPIRFSTADLVHYAQYLLPLRVKSVTGVDPVAEDQTINLRLKYWPDEGLTTYGPDPYMTVFATLDVSKYKPGLAACHWFTLVNFDENFNMEEIGIFRTVDVVALQHAEVKYEKESGRALLAPTSDLRHVLTHDEELLGEVRKWKITVGIVIQGGKTGLGFCNMNDTQIADFAAQVKVFCTQYNIGSITLWDKNAGYGREGMPEMNTTSYPKLIKKLRETLGNEVILSVADEGDPTATFYDPAQCGGIEVGKFIDFAWDGRMDTLSDPWKEGADRKPFAGLDKEKFSGNYFGCYYPNGQSPGDKDPTYFDKIAEWGKEGGIQKVAVYEQVAFLHGAEAGWMNGAINIVMTCYGADAMMGTGLQGMPEMAQSPQWGQYSNNYYYKDWD